MFSVAPSFSVPPILDRLGRASQPWLDPGTAAVLPGWLGDEVEAAKGLDALMAAIGPLIGALALAGYEVEMVAATPLPAGSSAGHVVIETGVQRFAYLETPLDVAIGHPMPPSDLCLACHVVPRRRFRAYPQTSEVGEVLAMALPSLHAPGDGGSGSWLGTGSTSPTWDLLHDPDPVRPDGEGWWLIGLSAGSDGSLAAMTAAAEEACRQLGALIAIDLEDGWTASQAGAPPPGLLRIFDTGGWHFLDGATPFSDRLLEAGRTVQGWLGRPASGQEQPSRVATPSERASFFLGQTTAPSDHSTGSLASSIESAIAIAVSGTGRAMANMIAEWAARATIATATSFAPTTRRIRSVLELPWAQGLMALHEIGLVDVIGREQIGEVSLPEWIEIDATGFFEQRSSRDPLALEVVNDGSQPDDTGIATDTMQVKVVGNHLIGYWQEHPRVRLGPRMATTYILDAWRDVGTSTFQGTRTAVGAGVSQPCTLTAAMSGDLVVLDVTVDQDGPSATFARISGNAFLSDAELARIEPTILETVTELQRHPLHGYELLEVLQIGELLRADLDAHEAGDREPDQIEAAFDASVAPYWVGDQLEQARSLLRRDLKEHSTARGGWPWYERSVDYLKRLNDVVQASHADLTTLSAFFELAEDHFFYEWELKAPPAGGIGVNLGGGATIYWWATMTVRKWRYVRNGPDHLEWTSEYWAAFGGAGLGITLELTSGMLASGTSAWVRHDLNPDWFLGPFATGGAQAGWSHGPLSFIHEWLNAPWFSKGARDYVATAGTLVFGPHPEDLAGTVLWTNSSGPGELKGFYYGAELSATEGWLFAWNPGDPVPAFDPRTDLDDLSEVHEIEYTGPSGGGRFFDTDVSTVDSATRDWLRDLCLEHLHLLRNRQGVVAIVGHADPQGADEYNRELSEARARSVYEAFADFLGPHLALPEEHTFIGGRGEWESLGENFPSTFAGDRRVDLYLNGERIISVRGGEEG